MVDFEPVSPALPLKPVKDNGRERDRRPPERRERRRPRRDGVTDDDGERRDDGPLVDDYA